MDWVTWVLNSTSTVCTEGHSCRPRREAETPMPATSVSDSTETLQLSLRTRWSFAASPSVTTPPTEMSRLALVTQLRPGYVLLFPLQELRELRKTE